MRDDYEAFRAVVRPLVLRRELRRLWELRRLGPYRIGSRAYWRERRRTGDYIRTVVELIREEEASS